MKERKFRTLPGLFGLLEVGERVLFEDAGEAMYSVFCEGDEAGGVAGKAPGIMEAGLEKYASLLKGLFCRSTGFRLGVMGCIIGGSLGGGTGGSAAKFGEIGAGAGMEVPLVREAVEGGKGGSLYEGDEGLLYDEEDGRLLSLDEWDVLEEVLKDVR